MNAIQIKVLNLLAASREFNKGRGYPRMPWWHGMTLRSLRRKGYIQRGYELRRFVWQNLDGTEVEADVKIWSRYRITDAGRKALDVHRVRAHG